MASESAQMEQQEELAQAHLVLFFLAHCDLGRTAGKKLRQLLL